MSPIMAYFFWEVNGPLHFLITDDLIQAPLLRGLQVTFLHDVAEDFLCRHCRRHTMRDYLRVIFVPHMDWQQHLISNRLKTHKDIVLCKIKVIFLFNSHTYLSKSWWDYPMFYRLTERDRALEIAFYLVINLSNFLFPVTGDMDGTTILFAWCLFITYLNLNLCISERCNTKCKKSVSPHWQRNMNTLLSPTYARMREVRVDWHIQFIIYQNVKLFIFGYSDMNM